MIHDVWNYHGGKNPCYTFIIEENKKTPAVSVRHFNCVQNALRVESQPVFRKGHFRVTLFKKGHDFNHLLRPASQGSESRHAARRSLDQDPLREYLLRLPDRGKT